MLHHTLTLVVAHAIALCTRPDGYDAHSPSCACYHDPATGRDVAVEVYNPLATRHGIVASLEASLWAHGLYDDSYVYEQLGELVRASIEGLVKEGYETMPAYYPAPPEDAYDYVDAWASQDRVGQGEAVHVLERARMILVAAAAPAPAVEDDDDVEVVAA